MSFMMRFMILCASHLLCFFMGRWLGHRENEEMLDMAIKTYDKAIAEADAMRIIANNTKRMLAERYGVPSENIGIDIRSSDDE